jgi:hypothetical protein
LPPHQLRPVTFDPSVARRRREDVVYAHLNSPLVAMSTRLLTAAAAAGQVQLSRVTAVQSNNPEVTDPLVVAYARFLVIGGDALRLHEEVLYAGGWLRAGRFTRVENLSLLSRLAEDAMARGTPVPEADVEAVKKSWPRAESGVAGAIDWRVRTRREQVQRALAARCEAELERNRTNFERFAASLESGLAEPDQAPLLEDTAEAAQAERDRANWRSRLSRLQLDQAGEEERIRARYADLTDHTFPLALVFVVPATSLGLKEGV